MQNKQDKQLKLETAKLRAKAQALLDRRKDNPTPKNLISRVRYLLDCIFTCADRDELWLPYPDAPHYLVSSEGRVKNTRGKEKILLPFDTGKGYLAVHIYKNGKKRCIKVHRLVAETFIYKESDDLQVNHIDGDKQNNALENLEWISARENVAAQISQKKKMYSQYTGVTFDKRRNKYKASCTLNGKQHFLGYHDAPEAARDSYQAFLSTNNIENKYAVK